MEFKVVVDTCVDFNEEVFGVEEGFARVPFRVTIDGKEFVDQKTTVFDQLKRIQFKAGAIRTACPSPGEYYAAFERAVNAFVVTISSQLSGSYAAAMAAKNMLQEELPNRYNIHIFDSKSATAGETLVTVKLLELLKDNLPAEMIVDKMNHYIDNMRTYFVLNSMDTLVSNGRVSAAKEFALKALKIFPIMGEDGRGKIQLKALGKGKKNAFNRMIELIGESKKDLADTIMAISHVDAYELACEIKNKVMERYHFKEVLIFEASGLSSVYASNGGIVIAF